jgi:hypothetical protein
VRVSVDAGQSARFHFRVSDVSAAYRLACVAAPAESKHTAQSDPDLYVSRHAHVSVGPDHYTWASQSSGLEADVFLSDRDVDFTEGVFHVALRAYGLSPLVHAELTLTKLEQKPPALSSSSNNTMRGNKMDVDDDDRPVCPHCTQHVSNLALHEVRCARLNFHCHLCDTVLRKADKDKHMDVVHAKYTCQCGEVHEQAQMRAHRRDKCPLRLVQCIYCPLHITDSARGAHQNVCGNRQTLCRECAVSVRRKELHRHLRDVHQVTDPAAQGFNLREW